MSQLNINKLYETAKKKELNKFENFDKLLIKCHNKIKAYADNHKTECLYKVPGFTIGIPLYNIDELQEYIVSSLVKNGLIVNKHPNYWLSISWDIKNKEKKKNSIKKKDNTDYRVVEDYNPSGAFMINEKAMMDMKEKSIKMLGI